MSKSDVLIGLCHELTYAISEYAEASIAGRAPRIRERDAVTKAIVAIAQHLDRSAFADEMRKAGEQAGASIAVDEAAWRAGRGVPLPEPAPPTTTVTTEACRRCGVIGHQPPAVGPAGHNCRVAIGQRPGPFVPWTAESGRSSDTNAPKTGPEWQGYGDRNKG